jgi:hypothetical protein
MVIDSIVLGNVALGSILKRFRWRLSLTSGERERMSAAEKYVDEEVGFR